MKTSTIKTNAMPNAPVGKAWDEVSASFDRFCLAAGIETLGAMMEGDADAARGPRHSRRADRVGPRGGRRAATSAQPGRARSWLGAHGRQERLPGRQGRNGATSGPRARRN